MLKFSKCLSSKKIRALVALNPGNRAIFKDMLQRHVTSSSGGYTSEKGPICEQLAILGGGSMAEAIIKAVVKNGKQEPSTIIVSDPNEGRRMLLQEKYAVQVTGDNLHAVKNSSVILLAVKPQNLDSVAASLQVQNGVFAWNSDTPLISILAGTNMKSLKEAFPQCMYISLCVCVCVCVVVCSSFLSTHTTTQLALTPPPTHTHIHTQVRTSFALCPIVLRLFKKA